MERWEFHDCEVLLQDVYKRQTYIRTDSTRISDEALAAVREMIQNTYGEAYLCLLYTSGTV